MSFVDAYNDFVHKRPYLRLPRATHMADEAIAASYTSFNPTSPISYLHYCVHLAGQQPEISDLIHQKAPWMPPGYNNILLVGVNDELGDFKLRYM
jgi:hypothetical protein